MTENDNLPKDAPEELDQDDELVSKMDDVDLDAEPSLTYECKICEKTFDKPEQLVQHNQNKKHRAKVKALSKAPKKDVDVDQDEEESIPISAKEKKKRRAKKEDVTPNAAFKCNVCKAGFPSKTKLVQHVEELGHARAK